MSKRAQIEDIGTLAEIMSRLVADVSYWEGEALKVARERNQLKAENEALKELIATSNKEKEARDGAQSRSTGRSADE